MAKKRAEKMVAQKAANLDGYLAAKLVTTTAVPLEMLMVVH
jgi:hypothetical protein